MGWPSGCPGWLRRGRGGLRLTRGQACALSLLAFTGASQFALAGTIAAGGSLAAGVASAVLLGSRNTLYALRLAGTLAVRGPARLLAAMGVIDETTAMATAQPDRASSRTAFWATFGTLYLTWNLATLVGAVGAGKLGSPQSFGLDVVGPAAFLALIWPRLRGGRAERAAAVGGRADRAGHHAVRAAGCAHHPGRGAWRSRGSPAGRPPGRRTGTRRTPAGRGSARRPGTGRRGDRGVGRGAGHRSGLLGLKLAGLVVPPRLLERPLARRFAELVPVALLAALIAVRALTSGQSLQADPARLAGMAAAVAALLAGLPFLA